ncbi:MAG TPA: iron ABC transporter permease [Saprospiraceae bacterium]|nr:iron ABC transporter permease [Saprospiraceae bacterium]
MNKPYPRLYWFNSWTLISLLIFVLLTIPLLTIVTQLFDSPGESWGHVKEFVLWTYLIETVLLMTGVMIFIFFIGVSSAWFVARYEFPGRKYFEWLLILPLAYPGYIMAYAYTGIFDYTGFIYSFLRNHIGLQSGSSLIELKNMGGAIFILGVTLYPYVYLLSRTAFQRQSKIYQETSILLGRGYSYTFRKIALPLSRPAIVAGLTLAAMEVLNDYGTVKYLGIQTFTAGIFRAWFSLGDVTTAVYIAAILLIFVFIILLLENKQRGLQQYTDTSSRSIPRIQLSGRWKWGVYGYLSGLFVIAFIFPFFQLCLWSFENLEKFINTSFYWLIIKSFSLAACSGFIIVIIALTILYTVRITPLRWLQQLSKWATLGYAIPGAVIAIGIMIPVIQLDRWMSDIPWFSSKLVISGSLLGLIFAYMVRFLAVGFNPLEGGFSRIGKHVNEMSRMSGKNSVITLLKIDLPLLKTSMAGAFILTFIDLMKELPLTLILRPFNFDTLATKTFDLATNEMIAESAIPALIIVLTGIIPVIILNKLIRTVDT